MKHLVRLSAVFILTFGCAAGEMRLGRVSTDVADVELKASACAFFKHVRVSSGEGQTEIGGWLRSRCTGNLNRPGHILIEIMSAGGDVLDKREVRYMPTRKAGKPPRKAHFHVLIPFEVPTGSRIRIAHHSAPQDH